MPDTSIRLGFLLSVLLLRDVDVRPTLRIALWRKMYCLLGPGEILL